MISSDTQDVKERLNFKPDNPVQETYFKDIDTRNSRSYYFDWCFHYPYDRKTVAERNFTFICENWLFKQKMTLKIDFEMGYC